MVSEVEEEKDELKLQVGVTINENCLGMRKMGERVKDQCIKVEIYNKNNPKSLKHQLNAIPLVKPELFSSE